MPHLVRVDISAAERRIHAVLAHRSDVAGVYLFGSALGLCRPDSDIDVGIIRSRALDIDANLWEDLGLAEELADSLGRLDGHPFHVTVLSLRAPFLAFAALHFGRAILVHDEDVVTDFVEEVALRYRRDYPRYLAALREINAAPSEQHVRHP